MQFNAHVLRRTIIPVGSSPDFCQWFSIGTLSDGGFVLHLFGVEGQRFGTTNTKKRTSLFSQITSVFQKKTLTYFIT